MNAAQSASGCAPVRPLLERYHDGELSPESMLTVESHVSQCARCFEELELVQAIQHSLQTVTAADAEVSPAFLARLQGSLIAERTREEEQRTADNQVTSLERWRSRAWPLLAAAAAGVFWFSQPHADSQAPVAQSRPGSPLSMAEMSGVPRVNELLDRLVDYHSHPPQAQVVEPSLVPEFEQEVGVRVQLPRLTQFGARWSGGSVVPVNQYRAAFLRYDLPGYDAPAGRRITVYVYDPDRVPVHASLAPRMVHDQPVYVGNRRGYTIAARQSQGVGYAIATDLTDQESAEIIASLNPVH